MAKDLSHRNPGNAITQNGSVVNVAKIWPELGTQLHLRGNNRGQLSQKNLTPA